MDIRQEVLDAETLCESNYVRHKLANESVVEQVSTAIDGFILANGMYDAYGAVLRGGYNE